MEMTNRPPVNASTLSDGRHPGYLLRIAEEPTPEGWLMKAQSPTLYRWYFSAWEVPTLIPNQAPELLTGITSTKFAPKGKFQASKAYTWTCQLLGRQILPGESVNYDALYPLPCSIRISRDPGKDFAKIVDVEAWPEGAQYLTESVKQSMRNILETQGTAPTPAHAPAEQPSAPPSGPREGMQTWGSQAPQVMQPQPAASGKPAW